MKPHPKTGLVHLGLGAFFRAHAAIYLQDLMAIQGGDWGVVGVSLRSSAVRDRLKPRGFTYTAVQLSATGYTAQDIDIINDVLVGPKDPNRVLDIMAAPETRIVSLTITEKGYCRGGAASALDRDNPDIVHDIDNPLPRSAPGYLVRALERRWKAGQPPFTVLSLDNLPSNGRLTRQVVTELAQLIDPELGRWIEKECRFPSTMVDRIVPATTDEVIKCAEELTGVHDEAAVAHEPFRQWVIEDDFVEGIRPALETVGVEMVDDVEPYENMKLRMLNGTHSALAYAGLLAGHDYVSEAMSDSAFDAFLESLWSGEIAPSLTPSEGIDLDHYAKSLKARYLNPEIKHRLAQIAMDGSQKLPQRILAPLFENFDAGRPYQKLLTVIGAWIKYLEVLVRDGENDISDPLKSELSAAISGANSNAQLAENIVALNSVFGGYADASKITPSLAAILNSIDDDGIHQTLKTQPNNRS